MKLKEKIEQEAIKYAEFNKFTSDRPFEFNRDKIAFTNGAYLYFDNLADEYAIEILKFISNKSCPFSIMYGNQEKRFVDLNKEYTPKELLEIFKKEKGYE